MTRPAVCALVCVLALALALEPGLLPAQTTGGQGGWGGGGGGGPAPAWDTGRDPSIMAPIPEVAADRVVFRVREATAYCGWLGPEFAPDCLADQYAQIAKGLPRGVAWDPVRAALARASADMGAVVARNAAPGVRPARPNEAGKPTQIGAGRALQRTGPRASAAAARVVAEVETRLLRSVSGSDQRAASFRKIAVAVGSAKVLLRST